jgi:hypothetical protein
VLVANRKTATVNSLIGLQQPLRSKREPCSEDFVTLLAAYPINKKQDIIETKNNTTNIQYQVVQFKGS